MRVLIDITGQRFGRLLVIKRAENGGRNRSKTQWLCLCDCGNSKSIGQSELHRGSTYSCGCKHKENVARVGRANWKGGPDSAYGRCTRSLSSSMAAAKKWGGKPCSATIEELIPTVVDKCALCGIPEMELNRRLSLDHNHETGEFRGWLCRRCNTLVGLIEKYPADVGERIIKRSMNYLGGGRGVISRG